MTNWGVRSMVWYVIILIIAFLVSIFYYIKFINEPSIQGIFF